MKTKTYTNTVLRISTSFAISIALFAQTGFALITGSFSDVPTIHPNFHAIEFLKERSIIGGYPDGTFKPDQTINRAEAMKVIMLGRSMWFDEEFFYEMPAEEATDENPGDEVVEDEAATENAGVDEADEAPFRFPDVPEDQWFYPFVYSAFDRDIVDGYQDGSFKPGSNINKAESMKVILLGFSENAELSFEEPHTNPFLDIPFSSWYAAYAQYFKDRMVIEPNGQGYYYPGEDITRGEFAEIIYRLLYMQENNLEVFDPSVNWETFNRSIQGYMTRVPANWEMIEEPSEGENARTLFWREDGDNGQSTHVRQFPNSATAEVVVTDGQVDQTQFFTEIRNAFAEDAVISETTTGDLPTLLVESENDVESIMDAYIYMPDGRIAMIYGTHGNGPLAYQNEYYLTKIREHFAYTEGSVIDDTNKQDVLDIARTNIQVDGKGRESLDLFDDLDIIETDTIGVGTGPVDYYWSKKTGVTIKYERSFDVILDIEEGRTSNF